MKATDLMVSDLVLVKPSMLPIKVAAVHKDKVGYHAVTHRLFWVRIGLLEPIPLTSEILEKNGEFGKTLIGETIYRMGGDDYCVREIGKRYSFIRCATYGASWWLFDIRYIHELQHALRLCGIEKEIVL